jgi:hypothetical protein
VQNSVKSQATVYEIRERPQKKSYSSGTWNNRYQRDHTDRQTLYKTNVLCTKISVACETYICSTSAWGVKQSHYYERTRFILVNYQDTNILMFSFASSLTVWLSFTSILADATLRCCPPPKVIYNYLQFMASDIFLTYLLLTDKISSFVNVQSKVKLSRYTPCRRYRGEDEQILLILDLGTRSVWVVSITPPATLYLRERTRGTHWIGGWVGLKSRSGHRGYRKNPLPLPGIEPPSYSL